MDPHHNDVRMIGLHGQGGAGKTTLSKAICNDIADRFDSWCFLPNVRETTLKDGLAQLQQALLRELLSDKDLTVRSEDAGKQLIKDRLCNKRVLVILDDVDKSDQLDALAGNLNWFGWGSRIILTTRNKHVLNSYWVPVYEVNLLGMEEADQLFRLHAFGEMQEMIKIDDDLINRFVKYAGKLPLALVVQGAFLRGRSECEWEGKMKELAESPDAKINTALKISFDGLEESHKEMFLDMACFYKGWDIDKVKKILDRCDFASSLGIAMLVERCLITVVDGKVQMHDLLVAMGQTIVREEDSKGNGMLSRIWLYEDFRYVVSEDRLVQERQAVKGIVLNVGLKFYEVLVTYNALKGFTKLRVLILRDTRAFENFVHSGKRLWLPLELRWLEWDGCSASAIRFDPSSKVVGLHLQKNKIQKIKTKGLEELKYLCLFHCDSLKTLPDLSSCRKLEELCLRGCRSLTGLDKAVGSLENLVQLEISFCRQRMTDPIPFRSKHLQTLDFANCSKLKKLPAIKEELKFLEVLNLTGSAIKELPDSIRNLVALKRLDLGWCRELTTIPSSIYEMRPLQVLDLMGCEKLSLFPRNAAGAATDVLGLPNLVSLVINYSMLKDLEFLNDLTCFKTLKRLDLAHNNFTRVPSSISKFKNLENLRLDRCPQLVEVTELPNVPKLSVACCGRLETLPSLHTFICPSPKTCYVDLSNCHNLDCSYMDRSLQLELGRGFVGDVKVFYPGEEFPNWVNFQTRECGSRYRVSFPSNMSKDDLSGLALFICFKCVPPFMPSVSVTVDGFPLWKKNFGPLFDGVHSAFFYVHRHLLVRRDCYSITDSNRRNITIEFPHGGMKVQRWGMRLLCQQEKDDDRIKVLDITGEDGATE